MIEKIEKIKKLKILFVEDEPELLNIISETLKKMGVTFYTAENGKEGLEILKKHADIDLIVTDINMPQMNGLEMISHIRKSGNDVKIMIMSAYSESEYLKKAKEFGVKDYILKPFDFLKFIDIVNEIYKD